MTSSLQKAAAAVTKSNASYQTSNGQFETCFAAGLDLSEFGTGSQAQNGSHLLSESAAAQLLQVKEAEKREREEEEAANQRVQKLISKRSASIRESIKKKQESNVVVNALVQMHGRDTSDPSVYRKHKKLSKKLGFSRPTSSTQSGGSKAHKKSRRSKY